MLNCLSFTSRVMGSIVHSAAVQTTSLTALGGSDTGLKLKTEAVDRTSQKLSG